jgi:hypothetical protein
MRKSLCTAVAMTLRALLPVGLVFLSGGLRADDAPRPLPPRRLYHYGSRFILMKDVRERNVPPGDWERFIMGPRRQYTLLSYRRGLYGTSHPAFAAYFGDRAFSAGEQPWFVAFELADGCRKPGAVAYASLLGEDAFFRDWFERTHQGSDAQGFASLEAMFPAAAAKSGWTCRFNGELGPAGKTASPMAERCSRVAAKYFDEAGIKVVLDEAWPEIEDRSKLLTLAPVSWYVRDRACLTTVRGTPQEVLEMMAEIPEFWARNPIAGAPEGLRHEHAEGQADFLILMRALADVPAASDADLEKIRRAAARSDLRRSSRDETRWIRDVVPAAIDAYRRCRRVGTPSEFSSAAEQFLTRALQQSASQKSPHPDLSAEERTVAARVESLCPG